MLHFGIELLRAPDNMEQSGTINVRAGGRIEMTHHPPLYKWHFKCYTNALPTRTETVADTTHYHQSCRKQSGVPVLSQFHLLAVDIQPVVCFARSVRIHISPLVAVAICTCSIVEGYQGSKSLHVERAAPQPTLTSVQHNSGGF